MYHASCLWGEYYLHITGSSEIRPLMPGNDSGLCLKSNAPFNFTSTERRGFCIDVIKRFNVSTSWGISLYHCLMGNFRSVVNGNDFFLNVWITFLSVLVLWLCSHTSL